MKMQLSYEFRRAVPGLVLLVMATVFTGSAFAVGGTRVVRAVVTHAVIDREPVDELSVVDNGKRRLYYFTEISGMKGASISHRWEHAGKVMAEVPLEIGGDGWRVWSSKAILPQWTGEWTVSVVAGDGSVLHTDSFLYQTSVH